MSEVREIDQQKATRRREGSRSRMARSPWMLRRWVVKEGCWLRIPSLSLPGFKQLHSLQHGVQLSRSRRHKVYNTHEANITFAVEVIHNDPNLNPELERIKVMLETTVVQLWRQQHASHVASTRTQPASIRLVDSHPWEGRNHPRINQYQDLWDLLKTRDLHDFLNEKHVESSKKEDDCRIIQERGWLHQRLHMFL